MVVKMMMVVVTHTGPWTTPLAVAAFFVCCCCSLTVFFFSNQSQGGLRWSDHAQWPRPEVTAVAGGKGGEGGGGSKRVRRSQKDWQADVKWKWKVVGLTLPTLSAPTVTAFGRRNATLNWLSGFRVQEGDSSEFGYNITW